MIRNDLSEQVKSRAKSMGYDLSDQETLAVLNQNSWEGTHCEYGESWWINIEDSICELKEVT